MRGPRFVAMFMIGALALAGCGGDDDDGGEALDEAVDAGDSSEDAPDDTGDDGSTGDDDGDDVDLDDIDVFGSEECQDALTAMAEAAAGATSAFTGGDVDLDDSVDQLRAYADAAPGEIRDDLQLIADAYGQWVEAYQESGLADIEAGEIPSEDDLAALEDLSESFDDEEFQAASERVNEWFTTECGVEE